LSHVEYVKMTTFQTKSSRRKKKEIEMGRDDLTSQITSKKRLFRVRLKSA